MQVVYERSCGLDVHKRVIAACAITPGPGGRAVKAVRMFGTMTADLLELADWLAELGVTHVAMERTGVYWKPVYNVLEGSVSVLVVNARHIKAVPGRKTDGKDCEWIADLLRHGLVRGSFVPDRAQRELRELTRYRTALIRERTAETNRLHKTLEGANIKLAAVVSDVRGRSARAMLTALVGGETDVAARAQLAQKRMRAKIPQLQQALAGSVGAHQRFLVAAHLAPLAHLDALIDAVSAEITARRALGLPGDHPTRPTADISADAAGPSGQPLVGPPSDGDSPWSAALPRLQTIPGVGQRVAEVLVAEIGIDMDRFATAHHLAAWAGMAPGNHESAGKRLSGTTRKGSPWLRSALVEAAHGVGRMKDGYLAAQFRRLVARRGTKKAAVAVGHSILVIAYHLLKAGTTYADLGANFFDERERTAVQRRLVHRLQRLGYQVSLTPLPAAR
jgi:transposase